MSLIVDLKYAKLASSHLEQFHQVKGNLFNFRCPYCGDSQHSKSKARGYLYIPKRDGSRMAFRCHNCGYGCGMQSFLRFLSSSLAMDYDKESFEDRSGRWAKTRKDKPAEHRFVPDMRNALAGLVPVVHLDESHPVAEYVASRMIPRESWKWLFHCEDFAALAKRFDQEYVNLASEQRLVLPIWTDEGTLIGVQGRAVPPLSHKPKYITVRTAGYSERLWYGPWRIPDNENTVFVVEGPIDSLFLPNAVAMLGLGQGEGIQVPLRLVGKRLVFVLDNEPRNRDVVNQMRKLIDLGQEVCIWPDSLADSGKDINEMVKNGLSIGQVRGLILDNAKSGLSAKLGLRAWNRTEEPHGKNTKETST